MLLLARFDLGRVWKFGGNDYLLFDYASRHLLHQLGRHVSHTNPRISEVHVGVDATGLYASDLGAQSGAHLADNRCYSVALYGRDLVRGTQ